MKKNNFLKILILTALVFCGYLIFVNGCDFNSPGISGGGLIENPTIDNSLSNLFEFKESEDFVRLTSLEPGTNIATRVLLVNPAMEVPDSFKFNSLEGYPIAATNDGSNTVSLEFDFYNGSEEEVWPHISLAFYNDLEEENFFSSVDLVISSDTNSYTYLPYYILPDYRYYSLEIQDQYFNEVLDNYFLISTKPIYEFEELINFDENDNRFESIFTPNLDMSGKVISLKPFTDEILTNELLDYAADYYNENDSWLDVFYIFNNYNDDPFYKISVSDDPFIYLDDMSSYVDNGLCLVEFDVSSFPTLITFGFNAGKVVINDDVLNDSIKNIIDKLFYVSKESIYSTGKWQSAVLDEYPVEEHIFNEDDSTTYELLICNSKENFIPSLTLSSTSGKNEYVSICWGDDYISTYNVSPTGTICSSPFAFEKNCNYTVLLENTDYYKITDVCDNWSDVGLIEADFNQYRLDLDKRFFHGYLKSVDLGVVNDNISCFTIGEDLFYYSDYLETLIIPDGITKISAYAFYCLNNLKELVIPASVLELEKNFFNVTDNNLTSLIVEAGNKNYDSRNNCNAIIETNSNTLILGSNNTIIPEGVLKIASTAFKSCMFESIIIPSSVKEIANQAFYDCSNLKSIYLNSSEIVSIAANSFDSSVEEIIVPANLYDSYYSSAQWANYKDILVRGSE